MKPLTRRRRARQMKAGPYAIPGHLEAPLFLTQPEIKAWFALKSSIVSRDFELLGPLMVARIICQRRAAAIGNQIASVPRPTSRDLRRLTKSTGVAIPKKYLELLATLKIRRENALHYVDIISKALGAT